MDSKININSSYSEVGKKDSFIDRHIGPSDNEINSMLTSLGYGDLEQLIQATVPNQILLDVPVDLDAPMDEQEALSFLDSKKHHL